MTRFTLLKLPSFSLEVRTYLIVDTFTKTNNLEIIKVMSTLYILYRLLHTSYYLFRLQPVIDKG